MADRIAEPYELKTPPSGGWGLGLLRDVPEETDLILAASLGMVHGCVCAGIQLFADVAVLGEEADADAHRNTGVRNGVKVCNRRGVQQLCDYVVQHVVQRGIRRGGCHGVKHVFQTNGQQAVQLLRFLLI